MVLIQKVDVLISFNVTIEYRMISDISYLDNILFLLLSRRVNVTQILLQDFICMKLVFVLNKIEQPKQLILESLYNHDSPNCKLIICKIRWLICSHLTSLYVIIKCIIILAMLLTCNGI